MFSLPNYNFNQLNELNNSDLDNKFDDFLNSDYIQYNKSLIYSSIISFHKNEYIDKVYEGSGCDKIYINSSHILIPISDQSDINTYTENLNLYEKQKTFNQNSSLGYGICETKKEIISKAEDLD